MFCEKATKIWRSCPVIVLLAVCLGFETPSNDDVSLVEVNITDGGLIGWSIGLPTGNDVNVQRLEVFLGIPYAEPPLGDLRFAAPKRKEAWINGALNATSFSPVCPQVLDAIHWFSFPDTFNNTDEDCLYLNVYSPKYANQTNPLPVMVWFHGGAYRWGAGQEYDGRPLALEGVVVVTVNFRIGVLGYLSTEDDVAPGNFGLLDQVLALYWVRNNIGFFRGDPESVTIFGESSGGGSVSLHTFSELSKGLFQAVIPQSGCALSPWAIYRPPHGVLDVTKQLAKQFNCSRESSSDIVDCLRDVPSQHLVEAKVSGPPMIAAWAPRVDGHFLKKLPEDVLADDGFHGVPMFTGTVRDESADEAAYLPNISEGFNRTFLRELFLKWSRRFDDNSDEVLQAVNCEYTDSNTSLARNRELFIELKSDYGYIAPHQRLAGTYSTNQPNTWMYSFQYRSEKDTSPKWMGVYHGLELYYVFGAPFAKDIPCPWDCINKQPDYAKWTDKDREISKNMMVIWSNFAKTRNPNPIPKLSVNLSVFNNDEQSYLLIENNPVSMKRLKPQRMNFWNKQLPGLLQGEITVNDICGGSSDGQILHASSTVPAVILTAIFAIWMNGK